MAALNALGLHKIPIAELFEDADIFPSASPDSALNTTRLPPVFSSPDGGGASLVAAATRPRSGVTKHQKSYAHRTPEEHQVSSSAVPQQWRRPEPPQKSKPQSAEGSDSHKRARLTSAALKKFEAEMTRAGRTGGAAAQKHHTGRPAQLETEPRAETAGQIVSLQRASNAARRAPRAFSGRICEPASGTNCAHADHGLQPVEMLPC